MANHLLTVLPVVLLATLVRGTVGFGDALVAMPLLALSLELKTATPLVALLACTLALAILVTHWRSLDWRSVWRLTLASAVGVPVGIFLLRGIPEPVLKGGLGLLLIGFSGYSLRGRPGGSWRWRGAGVSYGFGLVAGMLGGAYNTNGPPVVVYGTLCGWEPRRFRATLQGYFLATGLVIVLGHGAAGLWTAEVLRLYAWSLPAAAVGLAAGAGLHRRLSSAQFHRCVHGLLLVLGLGLLLKTVHG